LTVNVPLAAPASVTNTAQVSGGGDGGGPNNTANDLTNITNPNLRSWTLIASTATLDEDSRLTAFLNQFALGFDPGLVKTGTITARAEITPTKGLARFCPASQSTINLFFRDSDDSLNAAQVTVEIHQTALASGADTIIFSFDSNAAAPGGNSFHSASFTPAIDFNFVDNTYYVEIKVRRDNALVLANLGTLQIWESAGAACP
jgi:hypothetical protein